MQTKLSNENPISTVFLIVDDEKMKILRKEVKQNEPVIRKQFGNKYCVNKSDLTLQDITNSTSQHQEKVNTRTRKQTQTQKGSVKHRPTNDNGYIKEGMNLDDFDITDADGHGEEKGPYTYDPFMRKMNVMEVSLMAESEK